MYTYRCTMSIIEVARRQLQGHIDRNAVHAQKLFQPNLITEGWIKVMRQALGMSGAQLGRRMEVTRGLVSNTEKAEIEGRVTIKKMQEFADAMDCEFVYCMIPRSEIETTLKERAREKARAIVDRTNTHMALEDQALSREQKEMELDRMTDNILKNELADLWND